jgi:hypothetical protein
MRQTERSSAKNSGRSDPQTLHTHIHARTHAWTRHVSRRILVDSPLEKKFSRRRLKFQVKK